VPFGLFEQTLARSLLALIRIEAISTQTSLQDSPRAQRTQHQRLLLVLCVHQPYPYHLKRVQQKPADLLFQQSQQIPLKARELLLPYQHLTQFPLNVISVLVYVRLLRLQCEWLQKPPPRCNRGCLQAHNHLQPVMHTLHLILTHQHDDQPELFDSL